MYVEYSKAKDEMFSYTDTKISPWYMVDADNKRKARLNCIHHLLSMIEYEDLTPDPIELSHRNDSKGYVRPPLNEVTYVPEVY
jgi:polyphosphate kinase